MSGDGEQFGGRGGRGEVPAGDSMPSRWSGMTTVLSRLGDVLDAAQSAEAWQLSDGEVRDAVVASHAAAQRAQAVYLSLVRELDDRPSAVAGARPGTTARTFLRHKLHRTQGQAAQDARAAKVLSPDADPALGGLPTLGAALAAGEVSRDHADIAIRAIRYVPAQLLAAQAATDPGDPDGASRCGGAVLDQALTELSKTHDTNALKNLAKHLLDVVDPDGSNSFDPDAVDRRRLSLAQDSTGMLVLHGELTQPDAALVQAMLEHLSKPRPVRTEIAQDGTPIEIRDERTATQRRADALGDMARLAAAQLNNTRPSGGSAGNDSADDPGQTVLDPGHAGSSSGETARTQGGEPPRIVIHTHATDLAHARATDPATGHATGHASPFTPGGGHDCSNGRRHGIPEFANSDFADPTLLSRYSCDAVLQKVLLSPSGAVLDLGRDVRTISPAQRRALVARDRGCVIPGCTAPAYLCEAHHVTFWRNGGPTDLDNLALVCGRHHTDIHRSVWALQFRNGLPWARPPDWIDPQQRLIRNTYHDDIRCIRDLGTQLRLPFDETHSRRHDDDATDLDPPEKDTGQHLHRSARQRE